MLDTAGPLRPQTPLISLTSGCSRDLQVSFVKDTIEEWFYLFTLQPPVKSLNHFPSCHEQLQSHSLLQKAGVVYLPCHFSCCTMVFVWQTAKCLPKYSSIFFCFFRTVVVKAFINSSLVGTKLEAAWMT